jgi:uncharacterized RDD family membrane protein YckC
MMAPRYLSDASLHVAPELVGAPLASPARRLLAYGLDWALLVIPTIAVTVGAAALWLQQTDRPAFDALRTIPDWQTHPELRKRSERDVARLLVQIEAPGLPPAMAVAVEEQRLDEAVEILSHHEVMITLSGGSHAKRPGEIVLSVERLIPGTVRGLVLYGVSAVYFSVLTWLFGATLGKLVLGIRVCSLDGGRVPFVDACERFTGYLHIPALLFWPVFYLWRDPNRQLPHDRVARTVVLRTPPRAVEAIPAVTRNTEEPEGPEPEPEPSLPPGE